MAVSKMDIVNVIGGLSALNAASEVCGKSGVFHPDNPMLFYAKNQILAPLHEENPYQEPLQKLHTALKLLGKELPEEIQLSLIHISEPTRH